MAQFELEITTPEKRFFDEPVEMVVLPATDGELGVLAEHAPMVLVLKSGSVRIKKDGQWSECVIADGYAMVSRKRVLLLCQVAEWPEEEEREKEKLRQAQSKREFVLTRANLAHAMARLSAVRHRSINN